jgi:NADH-quinone oxidoreductase subunit C
MEITLPPITQKILALFGDDILDTHQAHGDETVIVKREVVIPVLKALKTEPTWDFNFLMDLTCVDYLTYPETKRSRFEVVYHLFSLRFNRRIRVKVPVDMGQSVATATTLWVGADWFEREAWEMYGVTFEGHPNLKRLMTHMDFVGYPLRKDYPQKKRQPLSESDTLMDEMDARLRLKGLK